MQTDELQTTPIKPSQTIARQAVISLALYNFRNHVNANFTAGVEPVVITGQNGVGKTNILEAISFLTGGRGLRKAPLREIDHFGKAPWVVSAKVISDGAERTIGTGRDENGIKRLLRIDGVPIKNHALLGEVCTVIWQTPQMDGLFLEGASVRRKFLDRIVYHFDPVHATRVNKYEYAMRERAKLLQHHQPDRHWLTALEATMAETSVAIAVARLETMGRLQTYILQAETPFPKANLAIEGEVEARLVEQKALATEEWLAQALRDARMDDRANGRTSHGVHRSDLLVTHGEKQIAAGLCSTGEQKALILSIILAEIRARAHWNQSVPIVLLDEVVAHLDQHRREALFKEIIDVGAQCWMTGTDPVLFEGIIKRGTYIALS